MLGSGVSIGDEVMSGEAIAEAQFKREEQHRLHQRNIEREAMQRCGRGDSLCDMSAMCGRASIAVS